MIPRWRRRSGSRSAASAPTCSAAAGSEAKRSSLPPGAIPDELDLAIALKLLELPREVGRDPESKRPVMAGINRYGPFVQLEKKFVRLEPGDDVLTVGMNRALALLNEPAKGRRAAAPAAPLRELGPHPKDNEPIQLLAGRFGPYVKHGKLNASLPKAADPTTYTVEQAVQLLADREAKLADWAAGQPGQRARPRVCGAKKATKPRGQEGDSPRPRRASAPERGPSAPAARAADARRCPALPGG